MRDNIIWENPWSRYMVMDEDGQWLEFEKRPIRAKGFSGWLPVRGRYRRKQIEPRHKPDWKISMIKRKGFTMNLISCEHCGIALDRDKLPEVKIYHKDRIIIAENVYWTGEDYLPRMDCPVCKGSIILPINGKDFFIKKC